ncbi:hypothetical protein BGZ46_000855 [Entomortierella lignicola]|nr:hypothetical protein BGZ46_000855 [Entomortierella lignicola]
MDLPLDSSSSTAPAHASASDKNTATSSTGSSPSTVPAHVVTSANALFDIATKNAVIGEGTPTASSSSKASAYASTLDIEDFDKATQLFYIVEGDSSPFPVPYIFNELIGNLKTRIKNVNPGSLGNIDARKLDLFRSKIFIPAYRVSDGYYNSYVEAAATDDNWLSSNLSISTIIPKMAVNKAFIQHLYLPHLYSEQTMNSSTDEPSEYAFQAEFSAIIRSLLSATYSVKGYRILVEAKERDDNDERSQRLDILVRYRNSPSYGYEFVVAPTLERFRDHVRRTEHYAKVHMTDDMLMINLCPKPNVNYFEETPDMGYSEETTSARRSSTLTNMVQPCYSENLQQPPEPFVFPKDVTVVNVTIRKKTEGWLADLSYIDGEVNTVTIKSSK